MLAKYHQPALLPALIRGLRIELGCARQKSLVSGYKVTWNQV